MFKRGGVVSRSLHAPSGVNIHGESKQGSKLKRKFSWSSPKVRSAISVGVLTHKPVVLKEGYLYKPGLFRIGARRRRWCVLRTYTQTEASIDIYSDETKSRYKGSIALDKASSPLLVVKNYDAKKKKAPKNCYLMMKIDGKRTYQFTTDSFRELKEWTALARQAIDNGHLFSGKVTEPVTISEGMVNVKFNANCISILCPINEIPIKTWRLDQITSFGQCGGMLMFESCSTCSDPGAARCSMNIIQEKPSTILNLMEKAIRNNRYTGEIHYERSILGDIYHCDHDCCQSRGMLAAFSEPNLFRSASSSPVKGVRLLPVDIHEFSHDLPDSTNSNDTDSGFPGTPKQADALSITSSIPSPVGSNRSNPSFNCRIGKDDYSSPKHVHPVVRENRSMSDTGRHAPYASEALMDYSRRQSEPDSGRNRSSKRLVYSTISTNSGNQRSWDEELVHYSTVQVSPPDSEMRTPSREEQYKLHSVEEDIYDTPNCEPTYWEVGHEGGDMFSPPTTPLGIHNVRRASVASNRSQSAAVVYPVSPRKSSSQSNYTLGSDKQDREDDFEELPPIPKHRRQRPPVKEMVKLNGGRDSSVNHFRPRLRSSGDVLDSVRPKKMSVADYPGFSRQLGSMDSLDKVTRMRSHSVVNPNPDITRQLHEQNEMLDRLLARSRNQRNDEEVFSVQKGRFKPYDYQDTEQEYDNVDNLDDPLYSSPTSGPIDKLYTKVAASTVRGYAYKVQIPSSNTQYDVPRRRAPSPDLTSVRNDAPPKPRRR